jgi:hypothetical protein
MPSKLSMLLLRGKMAKIPRCHPTRKHEAKGMCKSCYTRKKYKNYKTQLHILERNRAWRRNNPEQAKRAIKSSNLKQYGITVDDYYDLLKAQDGKCAICRCEGTRYTRELSVDHSHKTGKVRGLLCVYCNTSVGHMEHIGVENLTRLVEYINRGNNEAT